MRAARLNACSLSSSQLENEIFVEQSCLNRGLKLRKEGVQVAKALTSIQLAQYSPSQIAWTRLQPVWATCNAEDIAAQLGFAACLVPLGELKTAVHAEGASEPWRYIYSLLDCCSARAFLVLIPGSVRFAVLGLKPLTAKTGFCPTRNHPCTMD